jgi:hypothetical protein
MTVYYDLPVEPEVHECPRCGREEGHHLGCRNAHKAKVKHVEEPLEEEAEEEDATPFDQEQASCRQEGCQDAPKPWGGRGPRPRYCAAHGTTRKVSE